MRRKRMIRQKRNAVREPAMARLTAVLQQVAGMAALPLAPSSLLPRWNPCAT